MGNISIVHDDPVIEQCGYCDNGINGDAYCWKCGVDGVDVFDLSTLATLAHNLAIAGGLCRAFELGRGWECAFRLGPGHKDNRRAFANERQFYPGCHPNSAKKVRR